MNWQKWLYGLGAAVIGGGSGAVTSAISASMIDPKAFNIHGGLAHLLELMVATFLVSGLLHAFGYLQQSPLPQAWDGDDRRGAPKAP